MLSMQNLTKSLPSMLLFAATLVLLYLSSLYNYLLFHSLAELFSIVIAASIFVLAWNFRRFYKDSFLVFIGTAYLFCGLIDLIHVLGFRGMGIFPGADSNLATQLWIAARFIQSAALLAAPLLIQRKVNIVWLVSGFAIVTSMLLLSIFQWKIFPVAFMEGSGLTTFKKFSEYAINVILALAILVIYRKRSAVDSKVLRFMMAAISLTIISELAFTFYVNVYGAANFIGHYFKIIAFFLVYKAVIETEAGSIYTDMTQLRATQNALRESETQARQSEERLKVALAATPIWLFTQDLALRYTWVNNPQLGILPEEILGKRIDELLPPRDVAELLQYQQTVLENHQGVKTEIDLMVNGHCQHYSLVLEPLLSSAGEIMEISGAMLDRTELHQMQALEFKYLAEMEVKRCLWEHREIERQEIARNLHDGPIQDLLVLLFPIRSALMVSKEPELTGYLHEIRGGVKALSENLRQLCNTLRPPAMVRFGLEQAIRWYVEDFQEKNPGLRVVLDLVEDGECLPERIRLTLYRITQEALSNVAWHAQASEASVRFAMDTEQVTLDILDDGIGFNNPADLVEFARHQHFGMIGMKERAEAVGGEFQVRSEPGAGAWISVSIPRSDG